MLTPDSDRLSTLSDMPTSPLNIELIFIFFSAFLFMRLIVSVILSPFLASSSSFGEDVRSYRLNPQETTSTTEETTTPTTEETTSTTTEETTSTTEETTSTTTEETTSTTTEEITTSTSVVPFTNDVMANYFRDNHLVSESDSLLQTVRDAEGPGEFCTHELIILSLLERSASSVNRGRRTFPRAQLCRTFGVGVDFDRICPNLFDPDVNSKHMDFKIAVAHHRLLCSPETISRLSESEEPFSPIQLPDFRISSMEVYTDLIISSDPIRLMEGIELQTYQPHFWYGTQLMWLATNITRSVAESLPGYDNEIILTPRIAPELYRFLGRFVATCLRQTIPFYMQFPLVYYAKFLDQELELNDLKYEMEHEYNYLSEIMEGESNPDNQEIDGIVWTPENRDDLISAHINRIDDSIAESFASLKQGFNDIITPDVLGGILKATDLAKYSVGNFTSKIDFIEKAQRMDQAEWLEAYPRARASLQNPMFSPAAQIHYFGTTLLATTVPPLEYFTDEVGNADPVLVSTGIRISNSMNFDPARHLHESDELITFLRNRAHFQATNPDEDHTAEAFCVDHEADIAQKFPLANAAIEEFSGIYTKSSMCHLFNMGEFIRQVCPRFLAHKQDIHRLAIVGALLCSASGGRLRLSFDRARIMDTTIYHLGDERRNFRDSISIEFEGEAGIDAGGVFKDWASSFAHDAMVNDDYLFVLDTGKNQLRLSTETRTHQTRYKYIGRFLGIVARRQQATAPVYFPLIYYARLVRKRIAWSDLSDKEKRATGFYETMKMESNDFEDEIDGVVWTGENRQALIEDSINRFDPLDESKLDLIRVGLMEVLSPEVLRLLSPTDLRGMIEGEGTVNPQDLLDHLAVVETPRASFEYYQIRLEWFRRLISTMSKQDLTKLLRFVTGSDNCPMGGFKNLQPAFTVYLYANSADANGANPAAERNKLPNSHTCSNQIDIPLYETEEIFIEKIYTAINSDLAMGSG
jgi:hypothetical protein